MAICTEHVTSLVFEATLNTINGESRPCTVKWFSLPLVFYAESDSEKSHTSGRVHLIQSNTVLGRYYY